MSVFSLMDSYLADQQRQKSLADWVTCHACRRVGRADELRQGCTRSPTCALAACLPPEEEK